MEGSRACLPPGGTYSMHPPCGRGMPPVSGGRYQAWHIQWILWLVIYPMSFFPGLNSLFGRDQRLWGAGGRGQVANGAGKDQGVSQVGSQQWHQASLREAFFWQGTPLWISLGSCSLRETNILPPQDASRTTTAKKKIIQNKSSRQTQPQGLSQSHQ